MKITFLNGLQSTIQESVVNDFTADGFLDELENIESQELFNEQQKVNQGIAFILAQYKKDATSREYSQLAPDAATDLLAYDIDAGLVPRTFNELLAVWKDYNCAVYSTYRHTSDKPRIRLVVQIDRPLSLKDKERFKKVYDDVAEQLNIRGVIDLSANSLAKPFLLPQHLAGTEEEIVRLRFRGSSVVWGIVEHKEETEPTPDIEINGYVPTRRELLALKNKWLKGNERKRILGTMLSNILAGESYAQGGKRHTPMVQLAHDLVLATAVIDADGFADKWLVPCWEKMWPGESFDKAKIDWANAVKSANEKFLHDKDRPEILDKYKNQLVMCYGKNLFVLDVEAEEYKGPYTSVGLAAAVRDNIGDAVARYEFAQNGRAALRSAATLVDQYGSAVDGVVYHAKRPEKFYSPGGNLINLKSYKWCEIPAVEHQICHDLIRAVGGEKWEALEKWFWKLRDLEQPLPALTMIGRPRTWKSRIAQTIARFWTDPEKSCVCRAEAVFSRFNGVLLENPVVWSDEKLVKNFRGDVMSEEYRSSISETIHKIERKGIDSTLLHGATRHVISVNAMDKVFSEEIDADAVDATMERFLVLDVESIAIDSFEIKWQGTEEMKLLRGGSILLEHIRWLEENRVFEEEGRFFINTLNSEKLLLNAKLSNPIVSSALTICVQRLIEVANSPGVSGADEIPLTVDTKNRLRMRVGKLHKTWGRINGFGTPPTINKISRALREAGLKLYPDKATNTEGWIVDEEQLKLWVKIADMEITWEEISRGVNILIEKAEAKLN